MDIVGRGTGVRFGSGVDSVAADPAPLSVLTLVLAVHAVKNMTASSKIIADKQSFRLMFDS